MVRLALASWDPLGESWGHLGTSLGPLWSLLGSFLECLGFLLRALERILEIFTENSKEIQNGSRRYFLQIKFCLPSFAFG